MKPYNPGSVWSSILIHLGGLGLVLGALDPMEGAPFILGGSFLFALGTYLLHDAGRFVIYRLAVFLLIAFGVGAMWILSHLGGFGGKSGLSQWFGLLILPYLAGWSMALWGPKTPRWLLIGGIVVGAWYLVLVFGLIHGGRRHSEFSAVEAALVATGTLTIAGCLLRLRHTLKRT